MGENHTRAQQPTPFLMMQLWRVPPFGGAEQIVDWFQVLAGTTISKMTSWDNSIKVCFDNIGGTILKEVP